MTTDLFPEALTSAQLATALVQSTALRVHLIATLTQPPVVRDITHAGVLQHVAVEVQAAQQVPGHPHAVPLLAIWHTPDQGSLNDTYAHAYMRQAGLRVGREIVIIGCGLELATHHKQQVMRVMHVIDIRDRERLQVFIDQCPPTTQPIAQPITNNKAHAHAV
jgi:hypothetical protein